MTARVAPAAEFAPAGKLLSLECMAGAAANSPGPSVGAVRADLVAELRRLEEELRDVQRRLLAAGGETLPGIHLVIETAGRQALLSAARVLEVVRMVATTEVPGAPAHVQGTFVFRGIPVLAVNLGCLLGAADEPGLDAQIVVLAGAPVVGLVVARVVRLVEDPRLYEGAISADTPVAFRESRLAVGLCLDGEDVLPVLDASPIQAALAGRAA
jgi:purine-binding chemotaxis protein CheW